MNDIENPYIAQDLDGPIFRCSQENNINFCCEKCQNILIENYYAENFLGIRIKCKKCGNISATPYLNNGEITSNLIINTGNINGCKISETVVTEYGMPVCTEYSYKLYKESIFIEKEVNIEKYFYNYSSIINISKIYDELIGGMLCIQQKKYTSNSFIFDYTFAYCLKLSEISFKPDVKTLNKKYLYCLLLLYLFINIHERWKNHAKYRKLAKEYGVKGKFLHTLIQFSILSFFYDRGTNVGILDENLKNTPSPDLYLIGYPFNKVYIEIKTPRLLQNLSNTNNLNIEQVKNIIIKELKKCRQINKKTPGYLVFSLLFCSKNLESIIEKELESVFVNVNRESVAGIILFCIYKEEVYFNNGELYCGSPIVYVIKNKNYIYYDPKHILFND